MIVLLTGSREIGKSTVCDAFARLARAHGRRIGGVISRAQFDDKGRKVGIQLVDAAGGECRPFAVEGKGISCGENDVRIGRYRLDEGALRWGMERVSAAIQQGYDAIIIDEIGPLELEHGKGFVDLLAEIERHPRINMIIVVRPELKDKLQTKLGHLPLEVREVTWENRDAMPYELVGLLWPARL